jgi:hypothetical protein
MLSWLKVGAVMASNAHFSTLILVCFVRVLCRYCTGGIRCEMASAYIRSKGAGFENVFQVALDPAEASVMLTLTIRS